jgi:acetate kinase
MEMGKMKVLALNAGSSSLKACLYALDNDSSHPDPSPPLWQATAHWSDVGRGSVEETFEQLLESLWSGSTAVMKDPSEIDAVGHRVVHGGTAFSESVRITPDVRAAIVRSVELAPSHSRLELAGIETVDRILGPDTVQVAVLDTAFHASLPPAAFAYPGPYAWLEKGIRKYGFHGISHQYTAERTATILGRDINSLRLISCHLGNGCSLAAIRCGRSVDTTMGFTPLDGLMMGTRSGSVDPGILVYLLRHCGYSVDQLDSMLNHESGLLGVSGISADMRQILTAVKDGNTRAKLAFDVYVHSVRSHIGALLPSLGGLDALVFTAGVGENCASVRSAVCQGWDLLGLKLDADKNARSEVEGDISAADSLVRILVVKTQEQWKIAQECFRLARQR